MVVLVFTAEAPAQDKLDFTVGGLKWPCQNSCNTMKAAPFVKVEQSGSVVTFTDAKGAAVKAMEKRCGQWNEKC